MGAWLSVIWRSREAALAEAARADPIAFRADVLAAKEARKAAEAAELVRALERELAESARKHAELEAFWAKRAVETAEEDDRFVGGVVEAVLRDAPVELMDRGDYSDVFPRRVCWNYDNYDVNQPQIRERLDAAFPPEAWRVTLSKHIVRIEPLPLTPAPPRSECSESPLL